MTIDPTLLQSPFAETVYRSELSFLAHHDRGPRPPGWLLTPRSVVTFLVGSAGGTLRLPQAGTDEDDEVPEEIARELVIAEKLVGEREQVERCVITLASRRALLMVGAPGTGKSLLAQLLAAAISRTSGLVVQGTVGTSEEQLAYGWNQVALLSKGPSRETLVPSPVVTAMRRGGLVRVEELTRCRPAVQEVLLTILAERRLAVPELDGYAELAQVGFNVIATASASDGGAAALSPVLRRRFAVETLAPIADEARERALVRQQAGLTLDDPTLDVLVTAFRELRAAGAPTSTGEAIATATTLGAHATYLDGERDPLSRLPTELLALVLRDAPQDRAKLLAYWDGPVKRRAEANERPWRKLFELRAALEEG